MRKQFIKDYLRFTRGERRAVLLLLAVTLLVFVLPYWWPAGKPVPPDKAALQLLQRQLAQLKQPGDAVKENNAAPAPPFQPAAMPAGDLFYFDPNTLPPDGWKRLGLQDKTIQTILHYREKGGGFRRPEDLGRVYGLAAVAYARLLPYIRIAAPVYAAKKEYGGQAGSKYDSSRSVRYTPKTIPSHPIEINTADTTAFIALPGIGSRLAARIVHFREMLGGFYSVEQVGETYALPDSVFQKIKGIFQCDTLALRRIHINDADANTLKQHPYIRWNIANAIVAYRQQHGSFNSVEELQRIDIITPEVFRKLRPYLSVP